MTSGFEVHPAELRGYAQLIREQVARLEQVHATLAGVSVPAGAFGKLPQSADLAAAYEQHAGAEVANTAELPGLLDQVAGGLESSAGTYAAAESANVQTAHSVTGGAG